MNQNKVLKRYRYSWWLLGIATAVLLFVSCAAALNSGAPDTPLFLEETRKLSHGWKDSTGCDVTLPAKFPYPDHGKFSLETVLSYEDIGTGAQSLFFAAKYLNVRLLLDGEELGSSLCRPDGWKKTIGKTYVIIPLPENIVGKTLRIEAEPLIGFESDYEIIAPTIGSSGRIVNSLIDEELPMLVTISIIFSFGMLLFLFGFQREGKIMQTFCKQEFLQLFLHSTRSLLRIRFTCL